MLNGWEFCAVQRSTGRLYLATLAGALPGRTRRMTCRFTMVKLFSPGCVAPCAGGVLISTPEGASRSGRS
jgi:hypothetical protein